MRILHRVPAPWRLWLVLIVLVLLAHAGLIAQSAAWGDQQKTLAAEPAVMRFTLTQAPQRDAAAQPVLKPKREPTPKPQPKPKPEPVPKSAAKPKPPPVEPTTNITQAPPEPDAPPVLAVDDGAARTAPARAEHPSAYALAQQDADRPLTPASAVPANTTPSNSTAQAPAQPLFQIDGKVDPPPGLRLNYRAGGKYRFIPISGGEAFLDWSPASDGRYQLDYQLEIKGLGKIGMQSTGQWNAQEGLLPERFAILRKDERAAHFQRDKGIISFSNNRPDQTLQPGAQDMASLFVTLGALLQADPTRFPNGTVIGIQTASASAASIWEIRFIGQEDLHPPYGPLKTLHVQARSSDKYEYVLDWWLVPQLRYLPAQVRVSADIWHAQTELLSVQWK